MLTILRYGVPYADIGRGQTLTRRLYLLMALTPLVSMTAGGGLILLFLPPILGRLLLTVLLLNTAASVGDLYVANRVRQAPARAIFLTGDPIRVYAPRDG